MRGACFGIYAPSKDFLKVGEHYSCGFIKGEKHAWTLSKLIYDSFVLFLKLQMSEDYSTSDAANAKYWIVSCLWIMIEFNFSNSYWGPSSWS
jgi:hypothetical protein